MVLKRKEGLTFGEVDILWQLNLRVSDVVFRAVSSSPKVLSFFLRREGKSLIAKQFLITAIEFQINLIQKFLIV